MTGMTSTTSNATAQVVIDCALEPWTLLANRHFSPLDVFDFLKGPLTSPINLLML